MNSMKKFFFKTALFLGIGFTSVYGYDSCNYYMCSTRDPNCCNRYCSTPNPLGAGIMVGVYGSFHNIYFNVRDRITGMGTSSQPRYINRYDTIQEAPGGGGFISYGCAFCDRFVAAARFDAIGLAENAEHADLDPWSFDNVLHEVGLRWILDLTFQPGFLITNCALGYFKVGGTLGGVREQAWIKGQNASFDVIDKKTKCHYPGGYVLGAGANFMLLDCLSFFVEYDWHSYTSRLSSLSYFTPTQGGASIDTRITNLHSKAFSFGVALQF